MQRANERPVHQPKDTVTMRLFKTAVIATGLLASASYASAVDLGTICCDGGYEYRNKNRFDAEKALADLKSKLAALERERQRLADELAAAQKQNATLSSRVSDLERQLADRDREIATPRPARRGLFSCPPRRPSCARESAGGRRDGRWA